jgi:uncharacterized protein (DUF58 family)
MTTRGWGLAVSGLGLLIAGALVGIEEFYPLGVAALVLVAASRLWVQTRDCQVEMTRWVRPERVAAGGTVRVDLAARNRSRRRSPVLVVRDPLEGGRRVAEVTLAPLDAGEEAHTAYRLPALKRGVYGVGPAQLVVGDPFGLARRSRSSGRASRLVVHPPVDPLPVASVAAGRDVDAPAGAATVGQSGDEFFAIREYRTGDDLRNVHWASTAKRDNLMIRQLQSIQEGQMVVVADLRREIHDRDSLEQVLGAAAGLADAALRSNRHVRLLTTSGVDTGFGAGGEQRGRIFDALAAAETHAMSNTKRPAMAGAAAVVLTTDGAAAGDVALLTGSPAAAPPAVRQVVGAAAGPATTVVVFHRQAPGGDGGPAGAGGAVAATGRHGLRVVTVPVGATFPAAWARAAAAWRGGVATSG